MEDCLFCKIIADEVPSTKVYEDESVYVFENMKSICHQNHCVSDRRKLDLIILSLDYNHLFYMKH